MDTRNEKPIFFPKTKIELLMRNWINSTILNIDIRTIIAFSICLFFSQFSAGLGFCMPMPGGSDIVNLDLVDFYRPVVNQLPADSGWVYLFENFDELRSVIQTCRREQFLGPEEIYEFLQQLHPMQLSSLLESLLGTFRVNRPEVIEQCVVGSVNILDSSMNCMLTLEQIAQNLSLMRGIDISNQLLQESLPALVRGFAFDFPYEIERVYAIQLRLQAEGLYLQYARLFTLIYFV